MRPCGDGPRARYFSAIGVKAQGTEQLRLKNAYIFAPSSLQSYMHVALRVSGIGAARRVISLRVKAITDHCPLIYKRSFIPTASPQLEATRRFTSSLLSMERNGDTRNKRKSSPVKVLDRPTKLFKPAISDLVEDGQTPNDSLYSMESDGEDTRPLPLAVATADTAEWQATIEKVVRNVVSIHFCQTCSFDTDPAISSEATGFVVDAERGYILTNRHVVGAGPFWGYCIFDNHEEVGLSTLVERMDAKPRSIV